MPPLSASVYSWGELLVSKPTGFDTLRAEATLGRSVARLRGKGAWDPFASPATARHGPVLFRLLNRRAWNVAEGAEHAAVTRQGAQHRRAMTAIIKELAGVSGHLLGRDPAALGAGQGGGELHQESAFISGASKRSHTSAISVRAVPIASAMGATREGSGIVQD